MLEAVRTLATVENYTTAELESIEREFGSEWPVHQISIPVGVLVRARREYTNLKTPTGAVTSAARVVAAAEALVDAGTRGGTEEYLALCREVDNLRGYRHVRSAENAG
jgi:hypothetical protein